MPKRPTMDRAARLVLAALVAQLLWLAGPAWFGSAAAQEGTPSGDAEEVGSGEEIEEAREGGEVTEGGPMAASTLTVNVEPSGSMAEETGTGEAKIEAAKRAMREVIARIPEREGYNVGFRVYGQEGSNQEADRKLSCRSTELLVPIEETDADALLAEVEAVEPTGWTPLALALEEAGDDFAAGGESVTNAVIMVTDGEETCGGDPCAVAGDLNAAEIGLTTHVVGFGLTPEQQEAVRCIAEEGGGELFTAEDAEGLSEAVFSALERLEDVRGGYVGGNVFSLLPAGEPGALSVIAVGPFDGVSYPIVIRNGTGRDVETIEVETVARAGGELVGTGGDNFSLHPNVVEAGGLAIGSVFLGGEELPEGTELGFELDAEVAGEDESEFRRDLIVEDVNVTEDGVVGILRNGHEDGVQTVTVTVMCFDEAGAITDFAVEAEAGTVGEPVEPGGSVTFDVGIGGPIGPLAGPCPAYLVAGGGTAG